VKHKGLYRLLSAAIVDSEFRDLLLQDPAHAISAGYLGQAFALTTDEQDLVLHTEAQSLEVMAARIEGWVAGNGSTNGSRNCNRYGYQSSGRNGDRAT
jgi:hypothetical protein